MRRSVKLLLATTVISKNRLVPPSCQIIRLVTPGVLPLRSNSRGLIAVPSAMSPVPTEMRVRGSVLSMIMDFPTVSVRSVGEPWPPDCVASSGATGAGPRAVGRWRRRSPVTEPADMPLASSQRRTAIRFSLLRSRPAELDLRVYGAVQHFDGVRNGSGGHGNDRRRRKLGRLCARCTVGWDRRRRARTTEQT